MDFFLTKVSQQAVSFAIKSGITVTTTFAYHQIGRYIASTRGKDRQELLSLKERLQTKIDIISPAIDLVEIISARGNTSLESALTLTKAIRHDIESLGVRLSDLSNQSEGIKRPKNQDEIKGVVHDIKDLLGKIEDAVPFISLAVTTSGVELSSNIPHNVSPSRLLQASTLLSAGDTAYAVRPFDPAQIGTTFTLSVYMLFAGHSHRQEHISAKDLTWKEVIYKCRVKLQRIPLVYDEDDDGYSSKHLQARTKTEEYYYELCLIEDLDDGRVHELEELGQQPGSYEDVLNAGLRTRIPVHEISKLFYTNSGTLLGIEDSNSPILLLKRDINAPHPRKLMDRIQAYHDEYDDSEEHDEGYALDMGEGVSLGTGDGPILPDEYELPRHLDPEWLAFEIFTESSSDEDGIAENGSEYDSEEDVSEHYASPPLQHPGIGSIATTSPKNSSDIHHGYSTPSRPCSSQNVKSNLSVLECLLRLTALQNYQQASHLTVHDELLNLFLSDSALSGSRENRQLERENARRRIGFDPFGSSERRKQLPPSNGKKDSKLGSIQLTGTPPGKGIREMHISRGEEVQEFSGISRRNSKSPVTPSSSGKTRGLVGPNIASMSPEFWTPDQQLSAMLDHSHISRPIPK
ncbi:RanGTP-binding protein-domain-containing protein [Morchella snyderi]|nr:RanGTP-binding protein-domain-containing protein [Morchella snyderi]